MKQEKTNVQPSKEGLHTLEVVGYNSIYERKPDGSLGRLIAIADGLDVQQSKANAELIVKAVNERKALLDALKDDLNYFEEWNGEGNYTTRIEKIKLLLNNAKNI